MKHRLKLLQKWTDPVSNIEHPAGTVIELEDAAVAAKMVFDGVAEKHVEPKLDAKAVQDLVEKAVGAAIKKVEPNRPAITVKDTRDADPSGGYLPNGKATSKAEATWAFGLFLKDLFSAAEPGGRKSERMARAEQKSLEIRQKAAADGYNIGTESEGGFLLPVEFSTMLLDASIEQAVVRPRARTVELTGNAIDLPQFKNYTHTSNIYGGLIAYFKAENAQLSAVHGALEQISLKLNPLTILCAASHQMMRFSPVTVGSFLMPQMASTIAWKEDDAFINGTGTGEPLGILNSGCKIAITIESGQTLAASAIVSENLDKMFGRLRVESGGSVCWLFNKADCWNWLAGLKRSVGTAGAPAGLLTQMPNSPELRIYGYPLVDTEHCAALGTAGDIILADLSQYLIADDRRGPEIASSIHMYFDYGQELFRIMKYVDGQPRYRSVFTRQKSTNTTAAVLTIATRS